MFNFNHMQGPKILAYLNSNCSVVIPGNTVIENVCCTLSSEIPLMIIVWIKETLCFPFLGEPKGKKPKISSRYVSLIAKCPIRCFFHLQTRNRTLG